ncbi:MAG: histidine kinase [Bacteroidota bacterium]
MKVDSKCFVVCLALLWFNCFAQPSEYFFRQVTVADGLNDGVITAINQDKFGYMWFASLGGINRYNGYETRVFSCEAGDSASPYAGITESICSDKNGRLFFGHESGLLEFDFETAKFKRIKTVSGVRIMKMIPYTKNAILMATTAGLINYNPLDETAIYYNQSGDSIVKNMFGKYSNDIFISKDQLLFPGIGRLSLLNLKTNKIQLISLPEIGNDRVVSIVADSSGNIFLSTYGKIQLLKIPADGSKHEDFSNYVYTIKGTTNNNVSNLVCDNNNTIWATTAVDGLLQYLPKTNSFKKHLNNPVMPGSISSNFNRSIFQDKMGTIWLGCANGLNYFNPGKTLFSTIMPFGENTGVRNRSIARGFTEDYNGNFWFSTADGVSQYNRNTGNYKEWNNRQNLKPVLYYNSIRGIATDSNNDIWIATGAGVNYYSQKTNTIGFVDTKFLPAGFYFSANVDRKGRVWFGTRDYDSFYWYEPADKSFHSIKEIAVLKTFAGLGGRYVLEDSKNRLWFGFNGNGVGMYDPATNKTKHWRISDSNKTIIGGMVIDIKEDKSGVIWVSTSNGITGINVEKNVFQSYAGYNGLLSNTASALAVDSLNRLWIATSRGINMLNSDRTAFTAFNISDGLPTNEFPEHPGVVLRNGDFVFPSINGYVVFNPLSYHDKESPIECFVSSYTVKDSVFFMKETTTGKLQLNFGSNENFFTINLLAINYNNKSQTWYAYKLEGFDKTWHYSKDRKVVYTNVPGGNYQFKFKATTNPKNWNSAENSLGIHIATLFYKTTWFRTLMALILVLIIMALYRYRIAKQKEVYELQNKAQLLEQEKTKIMFESLKQQLNPHFLFNSLTSLSGLIETDQKMATNFLEQMSKIYRYILKNSNNELVSLKEEIAFVQVYITLQQTRFKKGLKVLLQADEKSLDKKIAPVTLQNLVENAIKHNIIDAAQPLLIEILTNDDCIIVKNNLQKKSMVETSNQQGLTSLQNLYRYLSSRPVTIENSNGYFTIRIPLIDTE